jgi:hypothetical protein
MACLFTACVLTGVSISDSEDVWWLGFKCGNELTPKSGVTLEKHCVELANGDNACNYLADSASGPEKHYLKAAHNTVRAALAFTIITIVFVVVVVARGKVTTKERLRAVAAVTIVMLVIAVASAGAALGCAWKVADSIAPFEGHGCTQAVTMDTGTHTSASGMVVAALALNCVGIVIIALFAWVCKPPPGASGVVTHTPTPTQQVVAVVTAMDKPVAVAAAQQQMPVGPQQLMQQLQQLQQMQMQMQMPMQMQMQQQTAASGMQQSFLGGAQQFNLDQPVPFGGSVQQSSLSGSLMYGQLPSSPAAAAPVASASPTGSPQPFPMYAPASASSAPPS